MRVRPSLSWPRQLAVMAALAILYVGAARIGLALALPPDKKASPVWPPSGIALAVLLLFGSRVWPGVWLGAFLANLWDYFDPANQISLAAHLGVSFGIAVGSTLQPLLGAFLLRGWVGTASFLDRAVDVFKFVGVALLMCLIAASIGVASLWLGGMVPLAAAPVKWWTWWLGDTTGILLVTPLVLAWSQPFHNGVLKERWLLAEAGLMLVLVLGTGLIVFGGQSPWAAGSSPLAYLTVPYLVWAAFRFGQRGATTTLLLLAALAVWGTAHGRGPFVQETLNESLLLLQTFVGVLTVTALAMAAVLTERRQAEEELHVSNRRRNARLAVTQILAQSASLADAALRILEAICNGLGWDFGAFWTVDRDGGVLRCLKTWHPASVHVDKFESITQLRDFAPGIGLPGRVWGSGMPVWIADVVEDANFPRGASAAQEGLHGAFGCPVHVGGEVLGMMEFFSADIRQPDADLLEMMGTIGSLIGLFIERKRWEQALRSSETRKTAILQTALDGIITIDYQGRIVEFNPAAERTFGYSREEVLGRNMPELIIPPSLREAHARGMTRYMDTGEGPVLNRRIEIRALRSDGTEFPVELSITPISVDGLPFFTAHVRDITERSRAESALRKAHEELEMRVQERTAELEKANLAKDRFLAGMSHELRTPLNAVIGFTGTLLMRLPGSLTADQEKQLKIVQGSARHLLSLINDLLDLAKIESGKVDLNPEPIVCQRVIHEVAASLRPLVETKGLHFETKLPDQDLVIKSDHRALTQILLNLANNAVKFTEHGTVCLEVIQRQEGDQTLTEFTVSDTGIGIRPEDQARLFQAFAQTGISNKRRHEGSGLGLYLSRKLAELLGGKITFESQFGQGSTFTLVLMEQLK